MKTFTDHLNRTITINFPPKRIVSLVPSQTELLYDLGLENELIGITRFCIHPKEIFDTKTKVGGTKNYSLDKIRALKPDLIIANKEENHKESLEALAREFPVWISDIFNLSDSIKMIIDIGKICNKEEKAKQIATKIQQNFSELKLSKSTQKAVYLIWKEPFMTVNKNTFIDDMMKYAGFENVFSEEESRYPEISLEQIQTRKPDYILLSTEPYPFKEKHLAFFEENFPNSKVKIVDGEMFSWYGSRLMQAAVYLETINN